MLRLANFTVQRQQGFLRHGLAELVPLTMKEAAQILQLHESTVSRTVAGKYIETPRGLYPWKFFFPRPYKTKAGAITQVWVKEQLKELIKAENKGNPYSDQSLSNMLKEFGICLSRRTVAKYRQELNLAARQYRRRCQ